MSKLLQDNKKKFGNNIEFESEPKDITCFLCPTTVDKSAKSNWIIWFH